MHGWVIRALAAAPVASVVCQATIKAPCVCSVATIAG
jgi:hypothetical protein